MPSLWPSTYPSGNSFPETGEGHCLPLQRGKKMSKKKWDFPVKGKKLKERPMKEVFAPRIPPMRKRGAKELVQRARAIQLELEKAKPLYAEIDLITTELLPFAKVLPKLGCRIVDNFATKNTQFKANFFRRFELIVK